MPLLLDSLAPGCDSYLWTLPPIQPEVVQAWSYKGTMRSFKWGSGGVVKSRSAFGAHRTPEAFYDLLEQGASRGVYRPSSYASFFHNRYHAPSASGPARRAMAWVVPGGWEALLIPKGNHSGHWYRYDIRSAYLWALFAGLPDPKSYQYTERVSLTRDGCYVMDVRRNPAAPYPYSAGGVWPVLRDEIDLYGLTGKLRYGITWRQNMPSDDMVKEIMSWPFWKEIARAYWGQWLATAPTDCTSYDGKCNRTNRWQLPPMRANPIWAHVILSRVRARLFEATRLGRVARVYVDNVIIDSPLPTGDSPGAWRLEAEYDGIKVEHLHRITSLGVVLYAAA